MIVALPFTLSHDEADELIARARAALDQTLDALKS